MVGFANRIIYCSIGVLMCGTFVAGCNNKVEEKHSQTALQESAVENIDFCTNIAIRGSGNDTFNCKIEYSNSRYIVKLQQQSISILKNDKEYWIAELPFAPNYISPNPKTPILALGFSEKGSRYVDRILFLFINMKTIAKYDDEFTDDGAVLHASWPRCSKSGIWSPGGGDFIAFRPWEWGPVHIVETRSLQKYLLDGAPIRRVLSNITSSKSRKLCGFVGWQSADTLTFECTDEQAVWSQDYNVDTDLYSNAECVQGDCLKTQIGYLEFRWNNVQIDGKQTAGRNYNKEVVRSVTGTMYDLNECVKISHWKQRTIKIEWDVDSTGQSVANTISCFSNEERDGGRESRPRNSFSKVDTCFRKVEEKALPIHVPGSKKIVATVDFHSE